MSEVDLLSILANQDNKLMNEQSLQMSRPYRQRKFASHVIQHLDQLRLKLYTICASNQEKPDLNEVLTHIQQVFGKRSSFFTSGMLRFARCSAVSLMPRLI